MSGHGYLTHFWLLYPKVALSEHVLPYNSPISPFFQPNVAILSNLHYTDSPWGQSISLVYHQHQVHAFLSLFLFLSIVNHPRFALRHWHILYLHPQFLVMHFQTMLLPFLLLHPFTPSSATQLKPSNQSFNFGIIAKLPSNSSLRSIQAWNLTSYHITPCNDYAVFTEKAGRRFYENGTAIQFGLGNSTILSDGGTPPWPWGLQINPPNRTDDQGRRNVYISCGAATSGLAVHPGAPGEHGGGPVVTYTDGETSGSFYVCNSTLPYGPGMALYYRDADKPTPSNCCDLELGTVCLPSNEAEHPFDRPSWCTEKSTCSNMSGSS